MSWKKLTFILIPHYRATIKQISLPRPILYWIIVFLAAAIGIMIFYIAGFKGKSFYMGKTREINAENEVLERSITLYDSSLGAMKARITRLDSLNREILTESRISDRDLKSAGSADDEVRRLGLQFSSERTLQMIDRLDKESSVFERSFDSLYRVCMKNRDYLKRIPSIRPAEGPILKEFGRTIDDSSGREKLHEGVNINNVEGTPVVATADGVVKEVKLNATDENGIYVVLDHENGYETTYTHMTPQVLVKEGDKVTRGQRIGSIGRTGITIVAVAPHILYKVRYHGTLVNPALYFFAPEFSKKNDPETSPSQTIPPRS
jgi:murein DD-endopeptidase MepM/ murein hydrolase activator NlpD